MTLEQMDAMLKSPDGHIAAGAAPPDCIFGQLLESSGPGQDTKPSSAVRHFTAMNSHTALQPCSSVCT